MSREPLLRRRIKRLTWLIMAGLVVSGVTAIPLQLELNALGQFAGVDAPSNGTLPAGVANWIVKVRDGLNETYTKYPFVPYGTDWLAFGHFVIALALVGALRDPVRNCWLFTFGMIACLLVVPFAFIFGQLRGIPIFWRLIDCSFGVFGFVPFWLCRRYAMELDTIERAVT